MIAMLSACFVPHSRKSMLEDEGATSATMEKLKEVADLGSVEAMLTLGNTHLTGTDILPRNWKLAMGWLDKVMQRAPCCVTTKWWSLSWPPAVAVLSKQVEREWAGLRMG